MERLTSDARVAALNTMHTAAESGHWAFATLAVLADCAVIRNDRHPGNGWIATERTEGLGDGWISSPVVCFDEGTGKAMTVYDGAVDTTTSPCLVWYPDQVIENQAMTHARAVAYLESALSGEEIAR